jgi:hypothetical protein
MTHAGSNMAPRKMPITIHGIRCDFEGIAEILKSNSISHKLPTFELPNVSRIEAEPLAILPFLCKSLCKSAVRILLDPHTSL